MLPCLDDLVFNALYLVNEDKYHEAQNIIESILNNKSYLDNLNTNQWQYIADISLAMGRFDISRLAYERANNNVGVAFTLIILGEIEQAALILADANGSPAINWCSFLVNLFSNKTKVTSYPSFLEIRHFLEFTVYYLLLAKKENFINLLLDKMMKLLDINLDAEKLIGFAYFHFGEVDKGIEFLNNAIKRNQFDGEIYFVLGQAYLTKNSLHEALAMLENAKLFLPHHYPTKDLLEKVKSKID